MPQTILPFLHAGANELSEKISVANQNDTWFCFVGCVPVFQHDADDLPSFRMFTSQLYCQGLFGVTDISVKRAVKKYVEGGIEAFYAPRNGRGPTVITPEVLEDAERLFAADWKRTDVAEHLDIKYNTLSKAITDGRVRDVAPSVVEG